MTVLLAIASLAFAGSLLVVAVGTALRAGSRPGPFRLTPALAVALVREALAQLVLVALLPARRLVSALPPHRAGTRPPVLLVPGYGWSSGDLLPLAAYLRRRGWEAVWPVDNHPRRGDLPAIAAVLARRVEELCAATGAERVDVVGHSMGGIVAAWACQHLGLDRRVRRLVTLGSPWEGTPLAVFGRLPAARDLEPGAHLLRRLGPPAVPTIPIVGGADAIVPPGRDHPPGVRPVRIPLLGHNEMLLSPRAHRAVAEALERP